jgi:N-acetylneuraminic acid mutarotase
MEKRILFAIFLFFFPMGLVACQAEATEAPSEPVTEPVEVSEIEENPKPTLTREPEMAPTHTPEIPTQSPEPATSTPMPKPDPRYRHHLVYNQASDRFILFGGSLESVCQYQSDTWAYDLNTNSWNEMKTNSAPPTGQGAMAYDAESDRVVLFVGTLAVPYERPDYGYGGMHCVSFIEDPTTLTPAGETWVYDYAKNEWTLMETTEGPFGIQNTRMVYNTASDRMILFGGWYVGEGPKKGASSETWVYDLNSNTWTEMSPEVSPPGRKDHAMAYDAESDRVILWGGGGTSPIDVGGVWAYDLNTNSWEEYESSDMPRPIKGAAMVYDVLNDRTLLYFKKEYWAYDYNNDQWRLLSDSPEPLGLLHHSLVFDSSNNLILNFGGQFSGARFSLTNKTWVYDPKLDEWTDLNR